MSISFKYHKILQFFFFLILINCQLQDPNKNHGVLFLKNRSEKLIMNQSNINDALNILGQPHSKSISNNNQWIYIERVLTKGEFHKLGQNVLKSNNVLILEFNKFGILINKDFLDKDDIRKISFSKNITKNEITQKSFVQKFLQSVKAKMYGNRK